MVSNGLLSSLMVAVTRPDDIPHAVSALRLMFSAGIAPTLRTRIAVARMAARVQVCAPRETCKM